MVLSPLVDGVVLVVEANQTRSQLCNKPSIASNVGNLLGGVVNKFDSNRSGAAITITMRIMGIIKKMMWIPKRSAKIGNA